MKQEVIYEFRQYTQSGTLVLNNPAEVTFINQSPVGANIIINNTIILSSSAQVIQGVGDYFDRITLRTNLNEIDTTDYSVIIPPNTILIVICKYYR